MTTFCSCKLANIHLSIMTRGALCFFSVTISTALFRFQTTFFIVISSNSFTHQLIPTSSHPTSFSKCVELILALIFCEPATVILPPPPVYTHQLPCHIYLINCQHRHPRQLQRPTLHIILRRSVEVLSLTSFGHCRIDKHLYYLPPTIARSDFHRPRDDDTDSDDSRQASVKRLKDSQVEEEGKTYRVQGKTSVYTIIIAFTSMCTLMEDGHIEKLLAGCGNYVNNYTSEILMKGILRQTLVSTTLSGMQLHVPQNFTLLRFKQLLWFDLPQLHDKVFQFQWTYPDTWTSDDLHPIHFLSIHDATRKNFHFDYESWALSWIELHITYEQILGPSYGPVLQDIVNDIQQNDIGHLFDVESIVSLTILLTTCHILCRR